MLLSFFVGSDHAPLFFKLSIPDFQVPLPPVPCLAGPRPSVVKASKLREAANMLAKFFQNILHNVSAGSVSHRLHRMNSTLASVVHKYGQKPQGGQNPIRRRVTASWFDKECEPVHDNLQGMLMAGTGCLLRDDFRSLTNLYDKMKCDKVRQFTKWQQTEVSASETNSARFYHLIKTKARIPSTISLSTWAEYGKSLYQSTLPQHCQVAPLVSALTSCTLFVPKLVQQAIDSLSSVKAADQFGLNIELLKAVKGHAMSTVLAQLFNDLVTQGTFPISWAEAWAVPLFKSGLATVTSNYRFIMLELRIVQGLCQGLCYFTYPVSHHTRSELSGRLQEGSFLRPPPHYSSSTN